MTAIAGTWRLDGRPDAATCVGRMLDAQAIYGTDGAAWSRGDVALGRRIHRLLPEDSFDHGPALSPGGDLVGVADARLDNRVELLDALGASSTGRGELSDTAVLLAAFRRWKEAAFARLAGDFACAIWDRRGRRLVLARDCVGNRPLHYHHAAGLFAFASMPRGLHALDEIPSAPDLDYAAESLSLLAPYGPRTFFKGVEAVRSAHAVIFTPSGVAEHCYWRPARPNGARLSANDYVEGVRHHLETAVRAQLRGAGGRIASQLSAGLDSSAVTATAARVVPGDAIIALTAVPRSRHDLPGPRGLLLDEGPLAAATAALYPNIEHVISPSEGRSPFDALSLAPAVFDRPLPGLYNLVWLERLCVAARERGARVMLTGDMGNATISYAGIERLPELARAGRWRTLLAELGALVRERRARPLGALALALQPLTPATPWQALARARGQTADLSFYAPLRRDVIRRLDLRRRASEGRRVLADGYETRMRLIALSDLGAHRKGYLAAWGVDQRDPTSDRRLIEFCLAAPIDQFLRDGVPRSLARRAFADRLPAELLAARHRGWQAADWFEGLTAGRAQAADAVERIAASAAAAAVLDVEALRERLRNWPTNWTDIRVVLAYREGLIRAIAVGDFLRWAAGGG